MAGARIAFNNYLRDALQVAVGGVRDSIDNQGLDAFAVLNTLTDKDIQKTCDDVRSPGGMMPNPATALTADNEAAALVTPRTVPNGGHTLRFVGEKRLRQVGFHKSHMTKIQRGFTTGSASLARLARVWKPQESQKERDDNPEVAELGKPLKTEDARKRIENIDGCLTVKLGAGSSPLAHVVRPVVMLPEDVPDNGKQTQALPTHLLKLK